MIYGIGASALGEQLSVSDDEASVFMESFKSKFTGINLHCECQYFFFLGAFVSVRDLHWTKQLILLPVLGTVNK